MLMPSALSSCDSSHNHQHYPSTRLQSALMASPPASPPTLSAPGALGNLFNTCRSLQALLATPATNTPGSAPATQLPTPPMAHAPPPMKLRLRPRGAKPEQRKTKVVKRAPPRGANKRRRDLDDDLGRHDFTSDEEEAGSDFDDAFGVENAEADRSSTLPHVAPSTPKRARIAPEVLPLGLDRSDYHNLHSEMPSSHALASLNAAAWSAPQGAPQGADVEFEGDGEQWSAEDDRILVELVLEKLKLTKTEWQDCARSLGKDRNSLSRRWRSLMTKGDVGLKGTRASRRSKLHATWR